MMTAHEILVEQLTKADHSIGFCLSDLQQANRNSSATVSLIVLRFIEQTADLQNRIKALLSAIEEDTQ